MEFTREFVALEWCRKAHIGYALEGELENDFSATAVLVEPATVC